MKSETESTSTSTEFQLYVSGRQPNIIDYTEFKLKKYMKLAKDPQQIEALQELCNKYTDGTVAICWKKGYPGWLNLK